MKIIKKIFDKKERPQITSQNNFDSLIYMNESYSQQGEDIVLAAIFKDKKDGFYVDVGAHHPYRFSNSFKFYKMGWKGINIDAAPGTKDLFDQERPRDINIEAGIALNEGILEYTIFEDSALNTFNPETALEFTKLYPLCKIVEKRPIKVMPLEKVFDKYFPKDIKIDFMNIDCEGTDFEVLKSNNWDKYRPKVIVCEILDTDLEELFNNEIYQFLSKLDYKFLAKTGLTSFFISKN